MEPQFQTSFIPKTPLNETRPQAKSSVSILTFIATIIFISSIIAGVGVYFYKGYLVKKMDEAKITLTENQERFEPDSIRNLQETDKRLLAATEILSKHVMVTPLFNALEALTMKKVKFNKFTFSTGGEAGTSGKLEVSLSGVASDYTTIALQSDVFSKDQYRKYVKDVSFTNLVLTDSGSVTFNLGFTVDPTLLSYQEYTRRSTTQ
jgi:hypothetical protein